MGVLLTLVLGACGSSTSGSRGAALCSALLGLRDNQSDFQIVLTGTSASDAFAALDRIADRSQHAIDQLRAIDDATVRPAALELADIEAGLLPILTQIRSATDQAKWNAVTQAYRDWYADAAQRSATIGQRITQAGVTCTS